jgi:exopolysaccharide biosynthesis polyprenyl glycosylphosphotransferase
MRTRRRKSAKGAAPVAPVVSDRRSLARAVARLRDADRRAGRGRCIRRRLVAADILGLAAAFALSVAAFGFGRPGDDRLPAQDEIVLFAASVPVWLVVAELYGLYRRDEERADYSSGDEFLGVFHLVTVGLWLVVVVASLTHSASPYIPRLLVFWVLAIALVAGARAIARATARRSGGYVQNTIVLGAGVVGQLLASKLLRRRSAGINLLGFVDADPLPRSDDLAHVPILGRPSELPEIVDELAVDRAIVAFSSESTDELLYLIEELRSRRVQVDLVPRLFDAVGAATGVHSLEGLPLIGLGRLDLPPSTRALKRCFDLVAASVALVLLSPVFLVIAILVRLDSPGPAFYRHDRVGFEGRPIRLWKFRTMRAEFCRGEAYGGSEADRRLEALLAEDGRRAEFARSFKLREDPRVTRLGRWLRSTSLDELPQLFNVVRGDVSLVGPRPVTHEELARFGDRVSLVLGVKPGITGYWQTNGRSSTDYAERVRLEAAYVQGWSPGLDLTILLKTCRMVLSKRDAY